MRVGQNRKSAREKQPFRSQIVETGTCGRGFGDHHDVEAGGELGPNGSNNLAQSAAGFISINRPAHTLGGHKTDAGRKRITTLKYTKAKKSALRGFALFADLAEVAAVKETGGFWKTQPIPLRPGCVLRSGLRHLSGEAACGRDGGGGSGWRGRPWSSCGRGSRIAVCACAWKAGMCVS